MRKYRINYLMLLLGIIILLFFSCRRVEENNRIDGKLEVWYAIGTYYSIRDVIVSGGVSEMRTGWGIEMKWDAEYTLHSSPSVFLEYARDHGELGDKKKVLFRPPYSVPIGILAIEIRDANNIELSEGFILEYFSLKKAIEKNYFAGDLYVEKPFREVSMEDFKWMSDEHGNNFGIRYTGKDPLPKGLKLVLKLEGGKEIIKPLT